jgi:predicted transcriptional regulator
MARVLANAPIDDEPLSPEDMEAIREGREDRANGRHMSTEELLRALEQ